MRRDELLSLASRLAARYRIVPPGLPGTGHAGVFAGRRDGQSADFHDFREYQPGDDLRRVDWRAYARSGLMHLKLFREEVSPLVELRLDTSASMAAYPGKEQAELFLAAFMRGAALAAEGRPVLCLNGGRFSGDDFTAALAGAEFGGADVMEARPGAPAAGRAVRFHFSDFLYAAGVDGLFSRHAAGSLAFTPVLILSRSELEPEWRGRRRLLDVEAPDAALDLTLTDGMVAAYMKRLHAHIEALSVEARRHGSRLLRIDVPDGELSEGDCLTLAGRLAAERAVTVK